MSAHADADVRHHLSDETLFRQSAFVGGRWIGGARTIDVVDPATAAIVARVPDLGERETIAAIDAAASAFAAWSRRPAGERSELLEAWTQAILENTEDLARLMTIEQGKPLSESRAEVRYGASFIKWFAEEARRIYGDTIPAATANRRILVLKQPVGVVAAITPWNFPIAMITRKCGPALAAGCTIVIKPSELTPLSALALAVLAERVGFPPGVINVVTGQPGPIGEVLTASPLVRKLSFTGSTQVGKLLMQRSAGTLKRLSLELGGNAPFLVFADADVEKAVQGLMASKFRNAGQTCVCANRVLVQDDIYDVFASRLEQAVRALTVGNGLDEGVAIGPLISPRAAEKVLAHIDDALTRGAEATVGGGPHARGGNWVQPTVLTGALPTMRVASEETFGPVAPLFRFHTEAEALELANATQYGLAAYFYTENVSRSWRVAERLEFGMVGHNTGSVSVEMAPFGGIKESGFGREGSKYGVDDYLQLKSFHIGQIE